METPFIKIYYEYLGKEDYLYAKLEFFHETGSIKDRIASFILDEAEKRGEYFNGMPIVEATSGNTGIAFASCGARRNSEVHIFMPDWASKERIDLMESFGAKVYLVSKEEGGFITCIKKADELAKKINGYRPNQFSNQDNVKAHYEMTGKEIIDKLTHVDAFVSGIGTGGTLMGAGTHLQDEYGTKIIALEPDKMPLLSKGYVIGSHKIEGIGDEFIPPIVLRDKIDQIITIDDLECS